jgi:general nucleoside transport system permease protein
VRIKWTTQRVAMLVVGIAILIAVIIAYRWDSGQTTAVAAASVRAAAPLLLGALCGVIGERSGVFNIGIEGQMLFAAFTGFMAASYSGSLLLGIAAGIAGAMALGLFLAWAAVTLKMDQIIAGTVINLFALGSTNFYYVQNRTMPSFPEWSIPGLRDIPLVGKMFFDLGPLTYFALIAPAALYIALFKTRWGLRTRAVGEHPGAADTVGVNVIKKRYINLIIAAAFAGVAGLHLLQSASAFNRGMTNGYGFIALAVMIIGRWHPFGAVAGAMMIGFLFALQSQLQFNQALDIPPQFFGMIPYVLTIVVLAVAGIKARPPAAGGIPYEKEG